MNRIQIEQTVGTGGILRVDLPLGLEEAGQHVLITIEPSSPQKGFPKPDEWKAGIMAAAGSWRGDFVTEPTGPLENRNPLN